MDLLTYWCRKDPKVQNLLIYNLDSIDALMYPLLHWLVDSKPFNFIALKPCDFFQGIEGSSLGGLGSVKFKYQFVLKSNNATTTATTTTSSTTNSGASSSSSSSGGSGTGSVCQPSSKEAKFQELKAKYGSYYAYHGSSKYNWHSILGNSLKNFSDTEFM
jgi:hypothetical protein